MGGSLSILNNISSLTAENQLDATQASLNHTLQQLSSGSGSVPAPTIRLAWRLPTV